MTEKVGKAGEMAFFRFWFWHRLKKLDFDGVFLANTIISISPFLGLCN